LEISPRYFYRLFMRLLEHSRLEPADRRIWVTEATQCLRQSYLLRHTPVPLQDASAVLATVGNSVHKVLGEQLVKDGWEVEKRVEMDLGSLVLVGKVDAYHPKTKTVLEIKTSNRTPDKPHDYHVMQATAYAYITGAEKVYIVYIGRRDGVIRVFSVKRSEQVFRKLMERAARLRHALVTNTEPPRERGPWCENCPFKAKCLFTGRRRRTKPLRRSAR